MYQAYVVQMIGEDPCNIILGRQFRSIDEAYRAICNYEKFFGKIERAAIDPAGTIIPRGEKEKKKLGEVIWSWLKG